MHHHSRIGSALAVVSAALLGYAAGERRQRRGTSVAAAAATAGAVPSSVALLPTPPHMSPAPPACPPADRARQILRFGTPTSEGVKYFDDFVLAYDRRLRLPAWVFERVEAAPPSSSSTTVDRAAFDFYEDLGQHPFFRASNADFAGSGYDRGHMAAAGNHKVSGRACEQTFILSNICPQVGNGFNRHLWNSLERYVRSLTRHNTAVYVCSGPLFLPTQQQQGGSRRKYVQYEVLGNSSVAVPTHFFKVVLLETAGQQFELLSYVLPNMAHPVDPQPCLDLFLTPLDAIERAAGFLIFDQLPRHRLVRVNKRSV